MCSVTNHINALKGQKRHNALYSNAFALSGRIALDGLTLTQGVAALCPGLCAFALSGRIALDGLTPTQGVAALCPGLCAFAPSGRTPFIAKVHKVSSL